MYYYFISDHLLTDNQQFNSLLSSYDIRYIEEISILFPLKDDIFDLIFDTLYLFELLKVIYFVGSINNVRQWNKILYTMTNTFFPNIEYIDFTKESSLTSKQIQQISISSIKIHCPKLDRVRISCIFFYYIIATAPDEKSYKGRLSSDDLSKTNIN